MSDEGEAETPNTPPKKRVKTRNCQFNKDWLENPNYNKWLANDKDVNMARCTMCKITFNVKYDGVKAVKSHSGTARHLNLEKASKMCDVMTKFFAPKDSKESHLVTMAEISKTFHCVKHGLSYLSTDCGNKLDGQIYRDSAIATKIHLGRTKMEAIARNVLAPYSLELITRKLKEKNIPFSIATDASNKGSRKFFPLAVRFFDPNEGIQDCLLDFYEEADESSESITNSILNALQQLQLAIANVTAYGGDNASVNYGKHCSVYQKLTQIKPKIIKANCNCHILHNAAKHSLKLLSFDVESLVLKVFNSFNCSAKNVANLKECFQFVQQEYHQVLRHIPVRWLSLFQALDRLLLNWNAIKAYFLQQGAENCDRIIWKFVGDQEDQLSDQPTFAECYIYFVHHVLFIFQSSIKTLEQSHLVITDVYEIMSGLRDKLKRRKEDLFFGFKTNQALANFTSNLKLKFQEEAVQVYNRAIEYLEKWFDFENNVFLLFKSLNLKGRIPELNEVILIASHIGMDLQDADGDSLYEELSLLQNASPSFINQDISVAEKWCIFFKRVEVPILRNVVQMVLSIPCSNAYVERIFSIMNQLWNDDRNKLSVEMVKAELCIRSNIQLFCSEFYSSLSDKAELIKSAKSNTKYHFKF
ncbi:hat family dimerization domaincontaining protein-related [Holotrichia oblita]|uniref:Hat family dimerization domaincontaining protein-related n=1 Tax=Holotrichia oblita TaxID=644536 RepID=A0ACB9SRF3_HOLOL|nr:hat family dimerization domaincontaining protein-related [Holotrichia oblita]